MGLRIFIASGPGRENWLGQCLASIPYRTVTVITTEGYELGKLEHIYRNFTDERFVFLQDSCAVVSESFWSLLDAYHGSLGFLPEPAPFGCYMGIYERSVLEKIDWPEVTDKEGSIRYEREWAQRYAELAGGVPVLFPELRDANAKTVELYGRTNLVLENEYFRKWKGTWR